MPRSTLFDRVCYPKVMFACHVGVVRPFVLPKEDDNMPRPTSSDYVCCPREVMACHARRSSTVCAAQRPRCHAMPDAV